jgi:hypothetical protein
MQWCIIYLKKVKNQTAGRPLVLADYPLRHSALVLIGLRALRRFFRPRSCVSFALHKDPPTFPSSITSTCFISNPLFAPLARVSLSHTPPCPRMAAISGRQCHAAASRPLPHHPALPIASLILTPTALIPPVSAPSRSRSHSPLLWRTFMLLSISSFSSVLDVESNRSSFSRSSDTSAKPF